MHKPKVQGCCVLSQACSCWHSVAEQLAQKILEHSSHCSVKSRLFPSLHLFSQHTMNPFLILLSRCPQGLHRQKQDLKLGVIPMAQDTPKKLDAICLSKKTLSAQLQAEVISLGSTNPKTRGGGGRGAKWKLSRKVSK